MSPLLSFAIALVRRWTRFYTRGMTPSWRDNRRAEIESDLWEFHEDARRRGDSPASIAMQMIARLLGGLAHDVLWRVESADDGTRARRQSAWLTAAAAAATVCVAAIWALFWVASIVSLPPLPDAGQVGRVIARPLAPPPPPPPPPPRGIRPVFDLRLVPPPPPPPDR